MDTKPHLIFAEAGHPASSFLLFLFRVICCSHHFHFVSNSINHTVGGTYEKLQV